MKKLKTILLVITLISCYTLSAQAAINTDGTVADGSSMLDIKSDASGILIPRMTASQRNAISDPATGLLVFQTDGTNCMYFDGSYTIHIGDYLHGGIVFYTDGNGSGIVCAANGGHAFDNYYWSSTEWIDWMAWLVSFDTGGLIGSDKRISFPLHAARAF